MQMECVVCPKLSPTVRALPWKVGLEAVNTELGQEG